MEPIINSQMPEFKVQAFQNGSFKTVSSEDVKGKWAILPGGLHLCVPDRTGRRCREIRTVPGYGCRSILGKHRLTLRTQSMARCFGKHP